MLRHLGSFSDWAAVARAAAPVPAAPAGAATRAAVRDALGFTGLDETPRDLLTERTWQSDGVRGAELSWSVGYGPRAHGWLLLPADGAGPLPGALALHDHGLNKWYGKEKSADDERGIRPGLAEGRARAYGGRAFANALARAGFAVLAHDTFTWGSRRFEPEALPDWIWQLVETSHGLWATGDAVLDEIARYNQAAFQHEFMLEKYCALLGTTFAGVVAYEDRVALNVLRAAADVTGVSAVGLSGGGGRAALLAASSVQLDAAVIVGMMSSYADLLDQHVAAHTWMFFPHGWARQGDWPDLAASAAPMPLLVQYDQDDPLFPPSGMRAAHERIARRYAEAGAPGAYTGQFYPGPHKFDVAMQDAAFAWLRAQMG